MYVECSVFIRCNQSCCPHWQLPLRQPLAAAYGRAVCSQATLSYMPCILNCDSADGTYTRKGFLLAKKWAQTHRTVFFLCGFDHQCSLLGFTAVQLEFGESKPPNAAHNKSCRGWRQVSASFFFSHWCRWITVLYNVVGSCTGDIWWEPWPIA